MTVSLSAARSRALLLDIEGTTTPIAFVYDTLFPYALSILFLIVAVVWIIWVSVAAGSQAGVLAGVAAMIARFATFGVVAATLAGAEMSPSGLGLLVVASVLLVLLGWIPGTAKKAWSAPRAEL